MAKFNPICEQIFMSYLKQGLETEKNLFGMMLTKSVGDNTDFENFTFKQITESVQTQSKRNLCVNFSENELVFQDAFEIHSVTGSYENGDVSVFINMLDINTMEAHSVRVHQFPHIEWLLNIIEVVSEKCELTFNIDEDEDED
jgi:hypothetical protein